MASIYEDLDREFAPAWRPQPGDKLVGTVTDLTAREGEYGRYPIVTIRSDDGEFAVHCFHEVLANELARIAPKVGDRIGIKYSGKDRDGGYHRYRARGEGAGAFRWSEFGDTDDVSTDFADPSAGGEPDDGLPF